MPNVCLTLPTRSGHGRGGWNQMIFKVPSNPYHSMILGPALSWRSCRNS